MRIGIDMDETFCSTNEKFNKYEDYFMDKYKIKYDQIWLNKEHNDNFLNNYLVKIFTEAEPKKDAVKVVKELIKEKNEIYIITARSKEYIPDMEKLINDYLKNYDIEVNKIIIEAKDKVKVCAENKIDLMIDDNDMNCYELDNAGIQTIFFDNHRKMLRFEHSTDCWKGVYNIIQSMKG